MAAAPTTTEYLCFASFSTVAPISATWYLGTKDELRAGNFYSGVIQTAPQLGMTFGDELALVQASNIDLALGVTGADTLRQAVKGSEGIQVTLTLVMRQNWSDGTSTEQTYTQILTIIGTTLQAELVVLHLQDIEEQKLQALYPINTWQSVDWPELSSDDAGKPICEPVGTALKLPCVLLHSDSTNGEYWYGVCTGTPKTIAISSIASNTITLASAPLYALAAGQVLIITGSSAADGRYTVASASGASITTNEAIPASTGGNVRLMPHVLTVYRNKRVVAASEYSVQQAAFPGQIVNGSFASGIANWTTLYYTTATGTNFVPHGSSSITTGPSGCTVHTVSAGDYAFVRKTLSTDSIAESASGYYALFLKVSGGSCVISYAPANFITLTPGNHIIIVKGNAGDFDFNAQTYGVDFTITNVRIIPLNLTLLKFSQPQIDFNGGNYVIEADCAGVESQNCSTEIGRLLALAGATADSTTFTAAAAAGFSQLVDCDYGRGGQRRLDAILDDLLPVARAGLSRNSAGAYTIWQDTAGSPAYTYDESLGDLVNVASLVSSAQPLSVGLNYAPSSADSGQMQVSMTRPVTGGILAAASPREIRYLRDATTADSLLCYRAMRAQYNRTATVMLYRQQVNIGDKIALTSPKNWNGQITFTVWDVQRVASGNQLTCKEYSASIYTYTAGTLPPNAPTGYQPDYSFTAPLAPSALAVTATATAIANDGTTTARATVQATPPAANWSAIWFAAIHNVTGEIALAQGASIGGGNYGVTLGPLRPGEVYRLQCYAVNSNNVQGVVQSTFDTTAIGGSAGVTTFTTAGNAVLPATVASCTAAQVLGASINVSWPAIAGTNIAQYVLEKKIGAGAFAQVYAGLATAFTDTGLAYSSPYQYRVRAKDTYGNFSAAYATSGTVTPSGNVFGGVGGDIGSTTVATVNRTNTTTIAGSYSLVGWDNTTITHSLGRVPLCSGVATNEASPQPICAGVRVATTSSISINIISLISGINNTTVNALGVPHSHSMALNGTSGTATIDIW